MRPTILLPLILAAPMASAAEFTVDTTSDLALTACTATAADCSLRGALTAANQTTAADSIVFDIPSTDAGFQPASGHWLILVGNVALPGIEAPVLIDGYSQPGATENTLTPDDGGLNATLKIELRPDGASNQQAGLAISPNFFDQAASTIRGLDISRFPVQIDLHGSSAHRIEGCFLGTDILGTSASITGNSGLGNGIRLSGPGGYVIGGLLPAERNLISGMSSAITSFSANNGIRIQGNLIGTDISGTQPIGNRSAAIQSTGTLTNAQIGGVVGAARNVVSANSFQAIYLSSGNVNAYAGTRIEGNYFGTDVSGRRALGNGLNPQSSSQPLATLYVFAGGTCSIEFGGTAPGQANLVAYSGAAGVQAATCNGVVARGNRYRGNRGPAIDDSFSSNADGITPNDADDADEGGNRLQNHPVLTLPPNFLPSGGSTVDLSYVVDTAIANASYPLTVDFFRAGCGGGGDTLLASDTYGPADAQLSRNFALTSSDGANVLPLTVLVTDSAGNTSEFAPAVGETVFVDEFEDTPASFSVGKCD
jgi:hypothetical protein